MAPTPFKPSDSELFNEYCDPDATACALGDYNTWEENQVFMDREWEDDFDDRDYFED